MHIYIIHSSDINVKACDVIRYRVLSQNFQFCCFRAMACIRLWNWVQLVYLLLAVLSH